MDYLRSGYETFMKVWQNNSDLVRVRWFRVADDAKFFDRPHNFGSQHTWDREEQNPPEYTGESGYVEWTNSANPMGYTGQRHCGSDDAMSLGGIEGVDPPITTDSDGWSACCGSPKPIVLCGHSFPAVMRATLTAGSTCACGVGATALVEHRFQPETWGGITADHWWVPPGLPFPPSPDFSPWVDGPHLPLGGCTGTFGAQLYWYMGFGVRSSDCTLKRFLNLYIKFPFGAPEKRVMDAYAASGGVAITDNPLTVTAPIFLGSNPSSCTWTAPPVPKVTFSVP